MRLIGYITRRRCLGKKLTFADIQVESTSKGDDTENDIPDIFSSADKPDVVEVVFKRDSPSWDKDFDDSFPSKSSKLPYGGKVSAEVCCRKGETGKERDVVFLVCRWELLEDPQQVALAAASKDGTNGISCTVYLKSRGEAFKKVNNPSQTGRSSEPSTTRRQRTNDGAATDRKHTKASLPAGVDSEFSHGNNKAKSLRATIFATWILERYGTEYLREEGGVLDVAGGKGRLSIELAVQGMVPATIVDPLVRKHGAKFVPREAKRIRKAAAPHPSLVAKPFNRTTFLQECEHLLVDSRLLVGLHPDESTEDILDLALQYDKPVAIVPCCVFTGFFPLRALPDGRPVRTYEEFLQYLMAKDDRLRLESLPFEGRNQVVFLPP